MHINGILIPNIMIDLDVAINIMTKETMKKIQLTNIWPTPIVLQLVDISTIKPKGVMEDDIISIDS